MENLTKSERAFLLNHIISEANIYGTGAHLELVDNKDGFFIDFNIEEEGLLDANTPLDIVSFNLNSRLNALRSMNGYMR